METVTGTETCDSDMEEKQAKKSQNKMRNMNPDLYNNFKKYAFDWARDNAAEGEGVWIYAQNWVEFFVFRFMTQVP